MELASSDDLQSLRLAIEAAAIARHQPVFYIHSPEDLVCSASFVEKQDDNRGLLRRGPGGRLHDFLSAHYQNPPPLLLVNYENFQPADLVRFNTLLDKKRYVDGTRVPENTQIIGLTNFNKDEFYQGSDFYSRFNKVEYCPIDSAQLKKSRKPLPFIEEGTCHDDVHTINLFQSPLWKDLLLGRWVLKNNQLIFEEGKLAQTQGRILEIQNGPWKDPEFVRFWEEARLQNPHRPQILPADFQLIKTKGYNWTRLLSTATFAWDCQEVN